MKKIFKKLRVLSIVLLSFLLAVSVICCNNTTTPGNCGTTSGTTGGNTGGNTSTTPTLQSQIDSATAGSTVTLNSSNTGTSIVINEALTVDGNNISGLTVVVNSNVNNSVRLRNFSNANITVANATNSRMARIAADNTSESTDRFSKIGDGDLPLHIEGCTINKLDLEKEVALYLENGEKKSTITELSLKEGVEEFSFIEFDENGKEVADKTATPSDAKSKVEKLIIEDDGLEKINLIGGVISDVDFAVGVTASDIGSLKYDKEFADQFGANAKQDFLDVIPTAQKEDVAIAKHASNSGVYKFTMTRDEFNTYNGNITIIFMTDTQKDTITSHQGNFTYWTGAEGSSTLETVATYTNPVYAAIPAGHFKINETASNGLKSVQGSEFAYGDYAHAAANGHPHWLEREDIVVLSHYRNYNKEAFIVDLGSSTVDIYVNTAAIKKSDLVVCVGSTGDEDPNAEYGSKISEMDLSNYTPYLAVNRNTNGQISFGPSDTVTLNGNTAFVSSSNDLPYSQSLKMSNNDLFYAIFAMSSGTYPAGVSNVAYPNIAVPAGSHHPFEDYLNE